MKERLRYFWRGFKNIWRYYRGWKWLVFLGLSLGLFLSSYMVLIAKTTDVDTLHNALQSKTIIYDRQDQVAGSLLGQKGDYAVLDQIAETMRKTVVNTEDKRFYQHNGFDTMGIGRAFVRMLINRNTSGGGGSTLTQQLAKNAFLSQDQTFQRKLKELFLALELEKNYTKDEILEMYLNNAYFGNGVWGVEDAAMKYFGISASQLDWNQSMVLTGMLKGPNIYNPIDHYDNAIDRRNVIADLLSQEGVISFNQAESIKQSGINLYDAYIAASSGHEYPYYFDGVINEAIRKTSIPEDDLMSKGYQIYTNLDQAAQQALDAAYRDGAYLFNDGEDPIIQSAATVVDCKTGGVMAVFGGRGEYTYRGFNRASDMYRAPGSTIKPLAVYVPALEAGYNMHSMLPDEVRSYGKNHYTPENYNRTTEADHQAPMYYALAQSKNTTAVYLMDKLGIEKSVQKLKQFGIQVPEKDRHLPLALGAFSTGLSPQQLASAYASFANAGVRNESNYIRKIVDASGKTVYDQERPKRTLAMTKNVAADMTSMMLDTYGGYGLGYNASPDNGQIAGKTGTTEVSDGSNKVRDQWMVAYTPDFAIATWVGYDDISSGDIKERMPSGMSPLFKLQTSYLIAQSAQTPFEVTYASAMQEDSNHLEEGNWWQMGQDWLDQARQYLEDHSGSWWQSAKDLLDQVNQRIKRQWDDWGLSNYL